MGSVLPVNVAPEDGKNTPIWSMMSRNVTAQELQQFVNQLLTITSVGNYFDHQLPISVIFLGIKVKISLITAY